MNRRTTPSDGAHRESRQVESDIVRTRSEMDRTLDEIGDRLHPRHLLEYVLDLFRSGEGQPNEWAIETRRSGKRLARKIQRNPVPAVLIGAGAAWLWMQDDEDERHREMRQQWDEIPEHSGSSVDARTGEPYDADYGAEANITPAWHADYDWSDAHYDEASWTPRAESALTEMQTTVGDTNRPVDERVGFVAGKMLSLSGLKRSEIRRALHAQWDEIPSHSGSFVDARTGEPYDDSYGQQWRQLAAFDVLSSAEHADEAEDEGWRERAEQALSSMQASLSDASVSAKQRLESIGNQLSTLARSSRTYTTKYGQASRRKSRAMARRTKRGAQRIGHQVSSGYGASRDHLAEAMEENPLAMGVGVLGLGLLVGAMLPSTRREDEAIGESADAVKARGATAGREAIQRGQDIAGAAGEAAFDEAERQGLTPSQVAEQTRESVNRVAETLKEQTASAGDIRARAESVAQQAKEAAKDEMREQQAEAKETHSAR